MRKAVPFLLIFVLGLWLGYAALRNVGPFRRAADAQARRNVLAALERQVPPPNIADNPFVKASARIEPAVVNIDTAGTKRETETDIFGQPFQTQFGFEGKGSGVIISPDGYVVTNNHVIEGASIIRVTMSDNRRFDGRLIGANPDADLAVVKIDGTNLPSAELGDSSNLKVGEYVIAIGNPLGVGTTVTHGIISATDRRNLSVGEGRVLGQALQTDAPINKGNSGGPLANMSGQVIGINTAIASERGGGNIGIGFAIPINSARDILKQIIETGRSAPPAPDAPFLGIAAGPVPPDMAATLNLPSGQGVLVTFVYPLTAADTAGLKRGNVLIAMNGQPVSTMQDVRDEVKHRHVGDPMILQVVRGDGTKATLKLKIGRRPTDVQ